MSKQTERDKKELEKLTNQAANVLGKLNTLEKTFSRVKNEAEELLRKLLKRNG